MEAAKWQFELESERSVKYVSFPILILSIKIDLAVVAFFNVTIEDADADRYFEALLVSVEVGAVLALVAMFIYLFIYLFHHVHGQYMPFCNTI